MDDILAVLVEGFLLLKGSPPATIKILPVCDCPEMSPNRSKVARGQLLTALFFGRETKLYQLELQPFRLESLFHSSSRL